MSIKVNYEMENSNEPLVIFKSGVDYSNRLKTLKPKIQTCKKIDIYEACCKGRLDVIKTHFNTIINSINVQINKKDRDEWSLLHYAARFNHYYIVKYLLSHGADPNIIGGCDNVTPLHLVARYKTSGQNVHKRNISGDTIDIKTSSPTSQTPRQNIKFRIKDIASTRLFKAFNERSFDSQGVLISDRQLDKKIEKEQIESSYDYNTLNNDSIINALVNAGCDLNARDRNDATPLHYSAMARNVSSFEELMSYPLVNIECKDSNWMTPLHYAAEQGCGPIAQMILERDTVVNALNKFDMTPLHLACEEDHPDIVDLLLTYTKKQTPDKLSLFVNHCDRNGHSALHYASMSGNQQLVSLLLENNAECIVTNVDGNMTPLHYACAAGNVESVKLLVEKEPNLINEKNSNLETPLHIAASLNRYEIVKYLLTQKVDIDVLDRDNESPLFIAAKKDHVDVVRVLYNHDASIYMKNNEEYTAFHIAAYSNSIKTLKYFLSLNQSQNLQNIWDYHENRPIHLAVMNNNVEVIQMLIHNDAPIEAKNDHGLTPLLLAASKGFIEILKILLQFRPPLALDEDDANNTALHLAAENGFYRAISILVDSGIPIDNRNISQMTALDLACSKGHVKTVNALLDAEAAINISDNSKFVSPLIIACKNGHSEVVSILLNRGADVNKLDCDGRNCLDVAIDENRKDAVLAILNSTEWDNALRHVSTLNGINYSPLRRLIDNMPDVAEIVFDKCMIDNSLPKSHPKYQIFCNYEYLEDMYTSWGAALKQYTYKIRWKYVPLFSRVYLNCINSFNQFKYRNRNKNHPLSLIVDKNRTSLLRHPLVRYLVRNKWNKTSLYIYYFRLLLLLLTIIFLTGLCLTTASPPYPCITNITKEIPKGPLDYSYNDHHLSNCIKCPAIYYSNNFINFVFIKMGKFIVMFLAIIHILTGIGAVLFNLKNLFNMQALMELIGSFLSIIYVSGLLVYNDEPIEIIPFFRCTNKFRSIGALSVCLSWLSFVLFLSKLPKIGIYVVMYMDIFRTFVQFIPVYFMLIISFSIPFYMLFLDRYETNAYITPFKAIMKTLVSTVGEIEYDTFYNTKDEPPLDITYLILFLFILSNSIILMNLLVGLAVDDIQGTQSKAFLKRLSLQIIMTMEFESVLPENILRKYISLEESVLPNETKHQTFWSWWEFKSNPFADDKTSEDITERVDRSIKELNTSIRVLKHQIKNIYEKNNKIELMLEELLKRTSPNTE